MANPKKGTSQARNEFIWGWAFILPTMLGLIILNIYPIFKTIYESFFKTGDFGKGNIFIGFDNYVKLFHDAEVWQALLNTFKYAIVEVPFSIAIALVLAVLLNRKMKGRAVYRTIFFLPMVAAPAAIAMVWRWLFNSEFGLLNHIFHTKINWISDPKIAVYAIAVIGVWSIIGCNMVLFLSGLQEIPRDYYDPAAFADHLLCNGYPCYRCHAGIRPDLHGYGQKQSCTLQNTVTCLPVLPEFLCTE